MSTCIVCLNGLPGVACAYSIGRTFVTDGDVFFEDFGRTKYQRSKLFFSFLSGNEDGYGQVICLMAVGAAEASVEFLEGLTYAVERGEIPAWNSHRIRREYGDLACCNNYEFFVNVFDCRESGLHEHVFIMGKSSTGFYTYDIKEDMVALGAHGIGVDGAKMVTALDAFKHATDRALSSCEVVDFFNRWTSSLRETGSSHAVGIVDLRRDDDSVSRRYIDFSIGASGFLMAHKRLGSIAEMCDGRFCVECEGLHGDNQMVSYCLEGEVEWNGRSFIYTIDDFDDEFVDEGQSICLR